MIKNRTITLAGIFAVGATVCALMLRDCAQSPSADKAKAYPDHSAKPENIQQVQMPNTAFGPGLDPTKQEEFAKDIELNLFKQDLPDDLAPVGSLPHPFDILKNLPPHFQSSGWFIGHDDDGMIEASMILRDTSDPKNIKTFILQSSLDPEGRVFSHTLAIKPGEELAALAHIVMPDWDGYFGTFDFQEASIADNPSFAITYFDERRNFHAMQLRWENPRANGQADMQTFNLDSNNAPVMQMWKYVEGGKDDRVYDRIIYENGKPSYFKNGKPVTEQGIPLGPKPLKPELNPG